MLRATGGRRVASTHSASCSLSRFTRSQVCGAWMTVCLGEQKMWKRTRLGLGRARNQT
jgi:hypothetical protein